MSNTVQKNLDYKQYVVDSRLQYFKPHSSRVEKTFAEEISASLGQDLKCINPKFFYDKRGSALFERICKLPEYYLTRTEISILERIQDELLSTVSGEFRLVELGSGTSVKTRIILDALARSQERVEYFPIDISEILAESSEGLLRDYDNLHITGIIDTYDGGLEFLKRYDQKRNLIVFLGSSFGNFSLGDGQRFLKQTCSTMKPNDLFLIGLDLIKDEEILLSAYDDPQGVTAEFNLNVLSRINCEIDADFDLENFAHHVVYNKSDQRIEMYLKSLVKQSVVLSKSNLKLGLEKGELIHTEHSHKYKLPQISQMLEGAGFEIKHVWLDDDKHFSLTLASKR